MAIKSFVVIFLIALMEFPLIYGTVVDSCTTGLTPNVSVVNCDEPPCQITLGTTESLNMTFRSPCYLENASPYIIATAYGLPIPYPLSQSDICDGVTNTPCPLAENEYIEYNIGMYVSSLFPASVSMILEFGIKNHDQNDLVVVCFKFEAETVR